jgi:hypothetical protein
MSIHVTNAHLSNIVKLLESIEDKVPSVRQQVAMKTLASFMSDTNLVTALGKGLVTPKQLVNRAFDIADTFCEYGL